MPRATTAAWLVMPPRAVRMPGRRVHAVDVFGARLGAHEDHGLALALQLLGVIGREHDFATGRAGRGRKARRRMLRFADGSMVG